MVEYVKCQCAAPGCEVHMIDSPGRRSKRCEPCKASDHYPRAPKHVEPPGEAKGW